MSRLAPLLLFLLTGPLLALERKHPSCDKLKTLSGDYKALAEEARACVIKPCKTDRVRGLYQRLWAFDARENGLPDAARFRELTRP